MTGDLGAAERRFGCLFCLTGQELNVARGAEDRWDIVSARPVSVLKWRTSHGRKRLEPEVIFPSYVFFEAADGFEPVGRLPEGCLKVLRSGDGDWRLTGYDAWFACWLLDQDGRIGLSQAKKAGDRIQFQQGPLKDLEGSVVRVDRRGRSGLVELNVNGRVLRAWLSFELQDGEDDLRWTLRQGGARPDG